MKLKLINFQEDAREEKTGTCDLCFGTRLCNNPVFTFQKENNETVEIDGYFWSWGDYTSVGEIENIIDFADYVSKREFTEDDDIFAFWWLDNLVDDYNSSKGQTT